jgi:DNA-binding MarR family transcriptional regulator
MNDIPSTLTSLIESAKRLEAEVGRLHRENQRLNDRRSNRKKLTLREVQNIRELNQRTGWTQKQIAEAFDINPATVSRIVRKIYWQK